VGMMAGVPFSAVNFMPAVVRSPHSFVGLMAFMHLVPFHIRATVTFMHVLRPSFVIHFRFLDWWIPCAFCVPSGS